MTTFVANETVVLVVVVLKQRRYGLPEVSYWLIYSMGDS